MAALGRDGEGEGWWRGGGEAEGEVWRWVLLGQGFYVSKISTPGPVHSKISLTGERRVVGSKNILCD